MSENIENDGKKVLLIHTAMQVLEQPQGNRSAVHSAFEICSAIGVLQLNGCWVRNFNALFGVLCDVSDGFTMDWPFDHVESHCDLGYCAGNH